MQHYGEIMASLYDSVEKWGGFSKVHTPSLVSFFEENDLSGPILDLCAGTGSSSLPFLKKGYHTTLIDHSPSMLEVARKKVYYYILKNRAELRLEDAASFETNGVTPFGFVFSLYDAMNHLENLEALENCFKRVHLSLTEGGCFLFDMNTRKGLALSNKFEVYDKPELYMVEKGMFSDEMDTAYIHIRGFLRNSDGRYDRFDETIYNRVYAMKDIKSSLLKTGFRKVVFARIDDLNTIVDEPETENRICFICWK